MLYAIAMGQIIIKIIKDALYLLRDDWTTFAQKTFDQIRSILEFNKTMPNFNEIKYTEGWHIEYTEGWPGRVGL